MLIKDYGLLYDKRVLNHEITADKDIYRACSRDYKNRKLDSDSAPFYFDKNIADKYIRVAELLSPHNLALFQKAFIADINGWRSKRNHGRYYHEALYTMARKNAKSFLAALMLCSELLISELKGKTNQQFYILAVNLKQSRLTLLQAEDIIQRVQATSNIARNFKITRTKIYSTKTGSRIEALASNSGALNGLNPTIVDVDEVEAMKDDRLIQVIKSAFALQKSGLMLLTSTAGFTLNSPVRSLWKTAESELKDHQMDSRLFSFIYTQDSRDEIFKNPKSWIKSNPLLSEPKVAETMRPYLKNQLRSASVMNTLNSTITKNFNRFENAGDKSFIDPDKWKANTVDSVDLYHRSNVILGVDLSRTRDLTSISLVTPVDNQKYYTDTIAFVPTGDKGTIQDKEKADGIPYLKLENDGYCKIARHSYGFIPDDTVPDYIESLINKYHFKPPITVSYDPWGSNQLVQRLSKDSRINLVKVRQSPSNLSETIVWLYKIIVSHRLIHRDNPLFDYGFHNIEMIRTFTGIPYFNKHRNVEKIDCIFSMLDALKIQHEINNNSNKTSLLKQELRSNKFIF